jgi:hypothetical protein
MRTSRVTGAILIALASIPTVALADDAPPSAVTVPAPAVALPDCSGSPLPAGCVTATKQLDPSAFARKEDPATGAVTITWDPNGPGKVTKLPAPQPFAAVVAARAQVDVSQVDVRPPDPVASQAKAHGKAHASQYSGYCVSAGYAPDIAIGGWAPTHYARAHTSQACSGAGLTSHATVVQLSRYDGGWATLSAGSQSGLPNTGIDAWARYDCQHSRTLTYRTTGWFSADVNGVVIFGPQGQTADADHTCPT